MIMHAFSLLDLKTGIFNVPFFFPHPQLAIRAVADLAADPSTSVGRHPADFMLCQLGDFDDQAGLFIPQQPQQLGTARSFLPAPASPMPLFNPPADDLVIPPAPNGRA